MKLTSLNDVARTRFACVACAVTLALTAVSCTSPEYAEDTVEVRGDEVVASELSQENTEALAGLGYVGSEELALDDSRQAMEEVEKMQASATEAAGNAMEQVNMTWASFGANIQGTEALPVAQVFERAEALNGQRLVLEGDVRNVCLTKGCWMNITDGTNDMFVKFKDYGFFVPMDIAGKTARVEGVFKIQEISVADQKHYLMDEGKAEEAARITAPAMKYTFMADGAAIGS